MLIISKKILVIDFYAIRQPPEYNVHTCMNKKGVREVDVNLSFFVHPYVLFLVYTYVKNKYRFYLEDGTEQNLKKNDNPYKSMGTKIVVLGRI